MYVIMAKHKYDYEKNYKDRFAGLDSYNPSRTGWSNAYNSSTTIIFENKIDAEFFFEANKHYLIGEKKIGNVKEGSATIMEMTFKPLDVLY